MHSHAERHEGAVLDRTVSKLRRTVITSVVTASLILVNNQLDTQFFFQIHLSQFSTCFTHPRAHHQENQL
jgi:hypothetical protein